MAITGAPNTIPAANSEVSNPAPPSETPTSPAIRFNNPDTMNSDVPCAKTATASTKTTMGIVKLPDTGAPRLNPAAPTTIANQAPSPPARRQHPAPQAAPTHRPPRARHRKLTTPPSTTARRLPSGCLRRIHPATLTNPPQSNQPDFTPPSSGRFAGGGFRAAGRLAISRLCGRFRWWVGCCRAIRGLGCASWLLCGVGLGRRR